MNNTIDIHSRKTPTIHQLRRAGWKVRVIHGITDKNNAEELYDRFTRIEITSPEGFDCVGVANCSKKDQWNRKLGNRIALGRALKNYECIDPKYKK